MDTNNQNPDNSDLRKFGLIFAAFFALFFGLLLPWIWDKSPPNWVWYVSGGFAAVGLILPFALRPVYHVWMKIGAVLGWINTRIILGLVFFVLFAPLAILFRIFGRDSMQRKLESSIPSYRKPSHHLPRERMEKPY